MATGMGLELLAVPRLVVYMDNQNPVSRRRTTSVGSLIKQTFETDRSSERQRASWRAVRRYSAGVDPPECIHGHGPQVKTTNRSDRRGWSWYCRECKRIRRERVRRAQGAVPQASPLGRARMSEAVRKAQAVRTPEQRSESARMAAAAQTPEQRSEKARRGRETMGSERRSESARKGRASLTYEQRSESARKGQAARTPEQRRASAEKGHDTLAADPVKLLTWKNNIAQAKRKNDIKRHADEREDEGYVRNPAVITALDSAIQVDVKFKKV